MLSGSYVSDDDNEAKTLTRSHSVFHDDDEDDESRNSALARRPGDATGRPRCRQHLRVTGSWAGSQQARFRGRPGILDRRPKLYSSDTPLSTLNDMYQLYAPLAESKHDLTTVVNGLHRPTAGYLSVRPV